MLTISWLREPCDEMMMKSLYSVQEQDLKSNIYSGNLQERQATCRNVAPQIKYLQC
jgi:hypothetical protein